MYVKLFASLYQGTLRGKPDEILVFTNLLAHADKDGVVDMHWRAIADEVGLPPDRVKAAIENLEMPDSESRSPEEDGKRLIRLDEHRAWGWRVTNYAKYRGIKNEDERREQNRVAQERWRQKNKATSSSVIISNNSKPPSNHTDTDTDTDTDTEEEEKEETQIQNILDDFPKTKKLSNDISADFETAWEKFPARAGGNSKQKALKAWLARLAEGVSPAALIAGVERYAEFVRATDKLNTEYVKQAATFFGPDKHYAEEWRPPAKILKPNFESHHSKPSHKEFPQ